MSGKFVISIDFELIWGMLDQPNIETYKKNILGGRKAIRKILALFSANGIHATWATVGIMAFSDKKDMQKFIPKEKPNFNNALCSGYSHIPDVGDDEKQDPLSYGGSLVKMIASSPHQEIGSHTFSHYYCNEAGADLESFRYDLRTAKRAMKEIWNIDVKSIVFPRNQIRKEYLKVVKEEGFECYRGNSSLYLVSNSRIKNILYRFLRIADTYFPLFGENCYKDRVNSIGLVETRWSRFLRPYNKTLRFMEPLKINRIKHQMHYAAENDLTFHLWFHPHNFGQYRDIMIEQLAELIKYYRFLNKKYGMKSMNMQEISEELKRG